jgi:hypothetical protein
MAKSSKLDWRTRILRSAQRRFETQVLRPVAADLRAERAKLKKLGQTVKGQDAKLRKAMVAAELQRINKVEGYLRKLRDGARMNFERQLEGKGFSLPKLSARAQ